MELSLYGTLVLIAVVLFEFCYRIFFDTDDIGENNCLNNKNDVQKSYGSDSGKNLACAPVHQGPVMQDRTLEDFMIAGRFVPKHCRRPQRVYTDRELQNTDSTNELLLKSEEELMQEVEDKKRLSFLPKLPGCEPDGEAAREMKLLFPNESLVTIVRFLVARKGNVEQAAAMMKPALEWHSQNFPAVNQEIIPALQSGCFFAHGKALDGTPTLYFRGAFYDSKIATPTQYVLAAAYVIDKVMAESNQISVTVLVHACGIAGAANEPADINFIKKFIQVLSDNYPERLKRLVIYPFPWFGRAMWGIIKMFVDKRSQDKVILLPGEDIGIPSELCKYVDPQEIPQCCGGLNTRSIIDVTESMKPVKDVSNKVEDDDDEDAKELEGLRNAYSAEILRIEREELKEPQVTGKKREYQKTETEKHKNESPQQKLEREECEKIMQRIMKKNG